MQLRRLYSLAPLVLIGGRQEIFSIRPVAKRKDKKA
jgi:hypothetical protein